MQSELLKGERQGRTIVFFLGWGMDPEPFRAMRRTWDTLFVWDYRELAVRPELPEGPLELIAWSMGVWAAAQVLPRERFLRTTAVNGTPWPIDDTRGIPAALFDATLAGVSESGVARFRRRMCGGAAALEAFLAHAPKRSVADLHEELETLGAAIRSRPERPFLWDRAIACAGDRIFTPETQRAAFPGAETRPGAHWAPEVFAALLAEAPA